MVAQFNMSDYDSNNKLLKYQSSPNSPFRGTMRWFIEEGRWNRTYNFEEVQTLHNPKILTDFINWSKTYFPAEKYVLILSDHGDIFSIQDQPVDSEVTTINGWDEYRSCVDDYNLGNENIPLSVFGIEEGIKNSGVKMDLIYFDCCLTGQIESLYQLKNQTNFILSSSNTSYATNHTDFLTRLKKSSSTSQAMCNYIDDVMGRWDDINHAKSNFLDIFLTDTSKFDNVIEKFNNVKNQLIKKTFPTEELTSEVKKELRERFRPVIEQIKVNDDFTEEKIPNSWKNGKMYYYDFEIKEDYTISDLSDKNCKSIDILCAFYELAKDDSTLTNLVEELENALITNDDRLIVKSRRHFREYSNLSNEKPYSLGLVFTNSSFFQEEDGSYQKYDTLQSVYEKLAFDEVTKWSEFILKNDTASTD